MWPCWTHDKNGPTLHARLDALYDPNAPPPAVGAAGGDGKSKGGGAHRIVPGATATAASTSGVGGSSTSGRSPSAPRASLNATLTAAVTGPVALTAAVAAVAGRVALTAAVAGPARPRSTVACTQAASCARPGETGPTHGEVGVVTQPSPSVASQRHADTCGPVSCAHTPGDEVEGNIQRLGSTPCPHPRKSAGLRDHNPRPTQRRRLRLSYSA